MNIYPSGVRGLTFTVTKTPAFDTSKQSAPSKVETRVRNTVNPVWTWKLMYSYLLDWPWAIVSGLANTDLRVLMDFFLAASGEFQDFLFTDPDDNYVGPAVTTGGAPNTPLAQLPLVNDGAGNYYSPLQRTLGGLFYEDVTDLNGTPEIYVNGVYESGISGTIPHTIAGPGLALPTVSYMGMYVAWGNQWRASTALSVGATTFDASGHLQKVTTAGTTGTALPTFNDTGGTTTDGSAVWTDQGVAVVTAQFNFYFRVHFGTDSQDFEKFMNQLWCIGGDHSRNGSGMLTLESSRPASI